MKLHNKSKLVFAVIAISVFFCCKTEHSHKKQKSSDHSTQSYVLAFPGAEGFGKYAKGARAVKKPEVYKVTNLNDSGEGSFREAVSKPGRFVVFTVSGIIHLKSQITVKENITIAGQTAPGDGVMFYGNKISFTGANETIARYLRIRCGQPEQLSKNTDASGISNGKNIILDHLSVYWGLDEVLSINWNKNKKGFEPDSITIQNSIIAQGLHYFNHSAGGLIQSENGHISIIKNLYASNKTRNPKVKGKNEYVNNIIYNFGNLGNPKGHTVSGAAYIMGGSAMVSKANIINNYFISGPLTPNTFKTPFSRGTSTFHLFAEGNYFDNNKNGELDGKLITEDTLSYPGIVKLRTKPFDYPYLKSALSAKKAFQHVQNKVGANLPKRDEIDSLIISELTSLGKKGLYVYTEEDLPFSNNGLGNYSNAIVPKDSDNDGIPDKWENNNDLNKNDPTDALEYSSINTGYLNIEIYLNSLVDL